MRGKERHYAANFASVCGFFGIIIIGHFGKSHNTLCFPKFCISIVSSFSWDVQWFQEKTNLDNAYAKCGGTNKECYGIFRNGLLNVMKSSEAQ